VAAADSEIVGSGAPDLEDGRRDGSGYGIMEDSTEKHTVVIDRSCVQ
jgi:hypothetical protein